MFGVVLLTNTLLALVGARIYDSCELARDFLKLGVSREHVATWVCIAFHESRFDTAARNPNSGDHGLLQISELYWCGPNKACGVPCAALRDDDISDDIECALQIHKEHTRLQGDGFMAWVVYPHHCKQNAKKYLANCDGSLKDTTFRFENRGRVLKLQNHMEPMSFYKQFPNIDELKTPTISINSFLRGRYDSKEEDMKYYVKEEKDVTQSYNNNRKKLQFDWLNKINFLSDNYKTKVKINNIDDLQLPVFNAAMLRTPQIYTTMRTTTINPDLMRIKPPNPKRIETNQFRTKFMSPQNDYRYKNDRNDTKFAVHSSTLSTYGVTMSRKYDFTQKSSTMRPTVNAANKSIHTYNGQKLDDNNKGKKNMSITLLTTDTLYNTTSISAIKNITQKKMYDMVNISPLNTFKSINDEIRKDNIYKQRNNRSSTTSHSYKNLEESPTTGKNAYRTVSTTSVLNRKRFSFNYTPPDTEITTPYSYLSRPLFSGLRDTAKTTFNNPRFTIKPTMSSTELKSATTIRSTSGTASERTHKSTQSIFDLYLNPTKRPNIIFQLPKLKENSYKVRIFSEGALLVLSYPHFLYADYTYINGIIGMNPIEEEHRIFADLDPYTGTVIRGSKRAQFNLFMRPVTGISATNNLRTTLTPIFWVDEGMSLPEDLSDMIKRRLLRSLNIVDIFIPIFISLSVIITVFGIVLILWTKNRSKSENRSHEINSTVETS